MGRVDRTFKEPLLASDTFICQPNGRICGYHRALIDGFGIYVSKLYVAPPARGNAYGASLLARNKQEHPDQNEYVFPDEGRHCENPGFKRVGSIYKP